MALNFKNMTIFEYDNGIRHVKIEIGAYVTDARTRLELDGNEIFSYDILPRLVIHHVTGGKRMLSLKWLRLNLYGSILL